MSVEFTVFMLDLVGFANTPHGIAQISPRMRRHLVQSAWHLWAEIETTNGAKK